jgi:hypothetical protein
MDQAIECTAAECVIGADWTTVTAPEGWEVVAQHPDDTETRGAVVMLRKEDRLYLARKPQVAVEM